MVEYPSMIELTTILLGLGCLLSDCSVSDTVASRYGEQVTIATLDARLEWGHITPYEVSLADGYVAVLDCSHIGDWVVLRPDGSHQWEKFLVIDCASRTDIDTHLFMEHVLVEVDYWTSQRWGFDCLCGWPIQTLQVDGEVFIELQQVLALFVTPMYNPV